MRKMEEVRALLTSLMTTSFQMPQTIVENHFSEPLTGSTFRFDSIQMVYFILEIMKHFDIRFSNSALKQCFKWSLSQYCQYIVDNGAS